VDICEYGPLCDKKIMRSDCTLLSINWNNRPCLELMLKSYVKYHYKGEPLKLILGDNASQDDSLQFYVDNGIPYYREPLNIGHEQLVDKLYPRIPTKYVLLVDSDIIFNEDCSVYLDSLNDTTVAAGDLIRDDKLTEPIKPRIAPWFILFDIETCRKHGITYFRNNTGWNYDVGSQFYENVWQSNLGVHIIPRLPGNQDLDLEGMSYSKFSHLLRMSWDLKKHSDREGEVMKRREYVESRLNDFKDIDLRGKFV
jgi:hypothetical protein